MVIFYDSTPHTKKKMDRTKRPSVRTLSDAYGSRWCRENAPRVGVAVREWRLKHAHVSGLVVRVYDSERNALEEKPFEDILRRVAVTSDGVPQRLVASSRGQVALAPDAHVSTQIYELVVAAWAMCNV